MSKYKYLAPISVAAALAAAAAVIVAKKKKAAPAAPAKAAGKKAPSETLMKKGEYSFVSGFKDAETVTVALDYDALRFGFDVIGEDFPCYSSDSHVAVISGEDFSLQLEYAAFYKGEDFDALAAAAKEKYRGFSRVSFGANEGFRYAEGDGVCFCLPIEGDEYSYLLVTLIKAEGCDSTLDELAASEDLAALLGSLTARRGQ